MDYQENWSNPPREIRAGKIKRRGRKRAETTFDRWGFPASQEEQLVAAFYAHDECHNPQGHFVVQLALQTGARLGELLAAEWTDFDAQKRIWTIPTGAPADRTAWSRSRRAQSRSSTRRTYST